MACSLWRRLSGFAVGTAALAAAATAGWLLFPADPASAQAAMVPVAFQLNFTAGGYNAGFALALQEGVYKRAGLDVTIVKGQGSGITAQLVAAGKADIAYADALAVMQLIAKGAPMKVVATIYQSNPNAVTVLSASGIKSIQELKGRSVGVPTGQSQTAMIPILFKANGLSESDVNLVNMPGNAMIATLLQKQVDSILGSLDNYDIILRQRGVEVLSFPFADHGVATVSTSIIASNAFLAQHGDVVKKFVQASLEGWDGAIKRPDDAIKALVQTFPADTDPPRNLAELKAAIALICKNGAKFVGKAEPEAWARTVSVAQQVLGLSTEVPASAYYTYEALPGSLRTSCPLP
jgi:NitT/TauT family transport system substrate-binding protein